MHSKIQKLCSYMHCMLTSVEKMHVGGKNENLFFVVVF